jgi:hypothetical protein
MTDIPTHLDLPRQPNKGDIVRYRVIGTDNLPNTLPAIITRIADERQALVNLHVFLEEVDETACGLSLFVERVGYDRFQKEYGSWCWPEDEDQQNLFRSGTAAGRSVPDWTGC